MSVTVAAEKTISFKSPYTGSTFQRMLDYLVGQDGYVAGAEVSDNGVSITVPEFYAIQRGIIMRSLASITSLAVPTLPEPWYVVAAVPDDDPDSGIVVTATTSLTAGGVVIAVKSRGVWSNPNPVHIKGLAGRAAEQGINEGFGVRELADGSYELSSAIVGVGEAVTPDGFPEQPPRLSNKSDRLLDLDTADILPYDGYERVDRVVLRQVLDPERSDPAELLYARGQVLVGASNTVIEAASGIDRAHYYAKPGGTINDQWWVWGNGTALKVQIGPGGSPVSAITGTGNITGAWLCGQMGGDWLVVLYLDGTTLKLVALDEVTGAQQIAPVTLTPAIFTGDCLRPRGLIDADGYLHLVVEYDTGATPSQQIYYATYDLDGTFGSEVITPRNVNGAASGKNDTWPTIAIDRRGTVHVAYISATTAVEYGEFVYATIVAGITTTQTQYLGTQVGVDSNDNAGFVQTDQDNFRRPAIVVTPQQEVFVALGGIVTSTSYPVPLLFSPTFEERFGFPIVNVGEPYGNATYAFLAGDLSVDELGALHYGYAWSNGTLTEIRRFHLNPVIAPEGTLWTRTQLQDWTVHSSGTDASQNDECIFVRPGPRGGTWATILHNASIEQSIQSGAYAGVQPEPHPRDVWLAAINVPSVAAAASVEVDSDFGIFATRPKKMNYPVLVGDQGDYQGYDSLATAINALAHRGSDIVLRKGRHVLTNRVSWSSGAVRLRGEGQALIDCQWSNPNYRMQLSGGAFAVIGIVGDVVEINGVEALNVKAGDIIEMTGTGPSGFHVVLKYLGVSSSGYGLVHVAQNANGAPTGTECTVYLSGNVIENVGFRGALTANEFLFLTYQSGLMLRNVYFEGSATGEAVREFHCRHAIFEGLDFTNLDLGGSDHRVLQLQEGDGNILRNVSFLDGGYVDIEDDEDNLHIVGCHGDGSDAAKVVYNLTGTRSTPVFMIDCEGRVSGQIAYLISNVGVRVRTPEGGGAMEFEDDNTRAGAISDDAVKLSNGSNQELNGTTNNILIQNINQRLKADGDTMTGTLTMAANIVTNGSTRTIGASGSAATAFNIYANTIHAYGDIDPDATGQDLGNAGARWDAYLAQLDVVGQAATGTVAQIAGHDSAQDELLAFTGRLPNHKYYIVDAHGIPRPNGWHFRDDFNYEHQPATPTFEPTIVAWRKQNESGSSGALQSVNYSVCRLALTLPGVNDKFSITSGCALNKTASTLLFRFRLPLSTTPNFDIWFGFSADFYFHFNNSTDLYIYAGGSDDDTGLNPTVNTWYLAKMAAQGSNIYWAIYEAPDTFDYGDLGAALYSGSDSVMWSAQQLPIYIAIEETSGGGVSGGIDFDFVDAWGVDRYE